MKKLLTLIGICLILLIIFSPAKAPVKQELILSDKTISLIVVDTPATRERGLSGMEELPQNTGMLFIFDRPDHHAFWMKDMKFPIDIIWLDPSFKIIHIESDVSPLTFPTAFSPSEKSLYVLETEAHFAEENDLKKGNILNFSLLK